MEQVEALCDDICLIASGRILLAGDITAVKKRFGRNTVQLGFDGDGAFLEELAAAGRVEVRARGDGRAEVRLLGDYSAEALLDAARAGSDTLHLYAASYPTLREIFIKAVGDAGAA